MTIELEKQFFDTFELEPKYHCSYHDCNCPIEDVGKFNKDCPKQAVTKECDARSHKAIYPQITDRILLELICIINKHSDFGLFSSKIDELKDEILDHCLVLIGDDTDYTTGFEEEIKSQVQALFKEEQ